MFYHLILNMLLIFVGHHLHLCFDSKHFILVFNTLKLEIHLDSLKRVGVHVCVYVCQPRLSFRLSALFTILSVGLWLCSCKMTFGTLVIIFYVQNRKKEGQESSICVSSLLSKQRLSQSSYSRFLLKVLS